ncbi:uncharacterized protein LOC123305544 isoform X2 [Chrysoperla carnea]|uniref:uncharacterized protein LOC123305544 isoform X2 n=1 Tax=Chrysoperla carnea TaxID=189513 RepID=UPI001D080F29|nr:uncharacterized protein LOC123305544 isoform X2 [Chrysoperla carnea]
MDSKSENSKNKKTRVDENKSTVSKIKVVPLEKLRNPKNSTLPSPTRHSSRSNAGNKLNSILSATHKLRKEKIESTKTPETKSKTPETKAKTPETRTKTPGTGTKAKISETKAKIPENNSLNSGKTNIQFIKKEPNEDHTPVESLRSIIKLEPLSENTENESNVDTTGRKRKRNATTESNNSIENEPRRKRKIDNIIKKKSVTFAIETTEILSKNDNRREESNVNSAITPYKTNISPMSKKKKRNTKQVEVEDTPCEQMYVHDMLELNLGENSGDQQLTSHTDTDEDYVINEIKPLKKVKKKGRKAKIEDDDVLSFDEETGQESSNISLDINFEIEVGAEKKGKRGRKPASFQKEDTLQPPLYYKMKDRPGRGVRCIKCNTLVPEAFWLRHNCQMHNNLAWREGETPVDLSSREQVFRLWNQVIKSQLPLKCGRCGDKKLSAIGFYSHVKLCGKDLNEIESQRTSCKLCGARFLVVSLNAHMQNVHYKNKEKEDNNHITTDNIIDNAIKRQAANKALKIFKTLDKETDNITDMYMDNKRGAKAPRYYINVWKKQIANEKGMAKCFSPICDYQTKILDEILKHYDECKFAPQKVFTCKKCNYESAQEDEIVSHIKTAHPCEEKPRVKKEIDKEFIVEEHADNEEQANDKMLNQDLEMLRLNERYINSPKIQKQCYKFDFLLQSKEATLPMYSFSGIILWTRQFRELHYSNLLFTEYLKTKWLPVDKYQIEKYLPEVKKSIHTSQILMRQQIPDIRTYEHRWKEYNLFETDVTSNIATIFCGGPVCSMAWVPMLSSLDKEQYLAVFCKPNMKDSFKLGYSYTGAGLIQIWNFGVLINKSTCETTPKLALGIAHDYGIIWHMEWCPSGCYQENERLGLLALATSTGFVYIISVPFPNQLSATNTNLPVYKTKPIYQLKLQDKTSKLLGDTEMQVTKLKWSKQSGHDVLIAGYSNGMVAIWNLKNTSPLLHEIKDECIHLLPYVCFQAHASAVLVVDLPNTNDVRWLLTASHDQLTKFWDLNDTRYPIGDYKRGIVTDGYWCPHWNCAIVCFDDVLMQSLTVTTLISCRDFGYKPVPLLRNNSPCKCLAVNEWMNGIAQGSVAGEWQLTFPTQMFYGLENEKNLRHRRSVDLLNILIVLKHPKN